MNNIRVICNTSPVIGLMSIHRLELLWQLFDEVFLPQAVYDELCADSLRHASEAEKVKNAVEAGKFKIYHVQNSAAVRNLYGKLHLGELEVIIGAKEAGIPIAVIDERAARKMAAVFLVDTIGILGILRMSKNSGYIERIKPELDALRRNGYRISEQLYQQILSQAGECMK